MNILYLVFFFVLIKEQKDANEMEKLKQKLIKNQKKPVKTLKKIILLNYLPDFKMKKMTEYNKR